MRSAGNTMKIFGQGDLRNCQSKALKYELGLGMLNAFPIGAESKAQPEDLIRRLRLHERLLLPLISLCAGPTAPFLMSGYPGLI